MAAIYDWTHHGAPAAMDPRYAAELARLRDDDGRLPIPIPLRVGDPVRLTVAGKYAGMTGTIAKRGRTRYQVRTRAGMLSVTFAGVSPR
jgi:hypothetical protein